MFYYMIALEIVIYEQKHSFILIKRYNKRLANIIGFLKLNFMKCRAEK